MVTDLVIKQGVQILWVECISTDEMLVDRFIREKKIHNDDYTNSLLNLDERYGDFKTRLKCY